MGDGNADTMRKIEDESQELQLHVQGVFSAGKLLRMSAIPPRQQGASRVRISARR
jgi:hypothetical protein